MTNLKKNESKREVRKLSLKNLGKNPRIEEVKLEDEKFFAYEKQRSHN